MQRDTVNRILGILSTHNGTTIEQIYSELNKKDIYGKRQGCFSLIDINDALTSLENERSIRYDRNGWILKA